MKNELEKRKVEALESIVVELAKISFLLDQNIIKHKEIVKRPVSHSPSFTEFLTVVKPEEFDGLVVADIYEYFVQFCKDKKIPAISKNKFSRLVIKLGYETRQRRFDGTVKRCFRHYRNSGTGEFA